ncbi:methionine biosynthesis protein MetW [Nocardioides pantholopis]|uniref:methionine biosynthesis protein MetW n=1 Tax=Nocardioides pantholopis TaxID=2483798 RepID=UPI0013E326E2|nr:methionine biosynthesis protein MetW [Nocardioides pantholopis]
MNENTLANHNDYVLNESGFGSHNAIVEWVRPGSRILDVGCASGYLMTLLHDTKGCDPSGIEPHPRYAAEARATGFPITESAGAEGLRLVADDRGFDHVVYADVLEHMGDPLPVLRATREVLAPGGTVLISLPNIVSLKARLKLLRGVWEYEDTGIFDRTHLRFFTVKSAHAFVKEAGFEVARAVYVGPLTYRGGRRWRHINRLRPGLLANQIVLEARPTA